MNDDTAYISVADCCMQSGLSRSTITRLARTGVLDAQRSGRQWLVSKAALEAYCGTVSESKMPEQSNTEVRDEETAPLQSDAHDVQEVAPAQAPVVREALAAAAFKPRVAYSVQTAPLYTIHPAMDFFHKLTALVTAIVLIFGVYTLFESRTGQSYLAQYREALPALSGVSLQGKESTFDGLEPFAIAWYLAVEATREKFMMPFMEVVMGEYLK